ncbi:hypothetical protein FRC06_010894 [Ceratobasidium sp. 370]|nr:hypothetical protein FRC06_010894 [Ceratobasidium sp. 370]
MSFSATAQEQQLIKTVLAKADTQDLGVVTGDEAVKIFAGSGLPPTTLGEIWQLSDTDNNGFLTEHGLGIALRLIGWAQAGEKPKKELVARVGPLPTLKGVPIPGVSSNPGSPTPLAPSLPARPVMPQLTPDDRQKFLRMFFQTGPANGLLSGDKARDLFLKSKLPTDKLGQIWNLADTHERGSLDATDFVIGMFLIQSVMSGALHIIPPSLPPGLYEQASGGVPRPSLSSPLQAQFTGNSTGSRPGTGLAQRAASPIRAQFTGQTPLEPQYTGGQQRRIATQYTGQSQFSLNSAPAPAQALRPQVTGQPFAIPQPFNQAKWDVSSEEKAKSDAFFTTLDPQGRGFIEGDVAVTFMVQSQLPESILAQLKLRVAKPTRNLFDDDDDEAPPVANAGSPAPATATQSIEIANVQNQLSSTQRALDSATAARTAAVASSEAAAAELAQLQEQLTRASAARASEETHLAEVRARKVQQDLDLAKTREELIRAESEASAVRLERGEIEGGVLRDKEELRGVQKKVREVSEEVEKLKTEVEKVKREARQVKGLLAIARKQLAAGESEKAKVRGEIDEARGEVDDAQKELEDVERQVAEGQHAPATEIVSPAPVVAPTLNGINSPPRTDTLSPAQVELPASRSVTPAAAPHRSNSTNPFDRLRNASAGAASPALPFADVSGGASPFVNTPTGGSAVPFGAATSTSPFGPTPTSSSFDAVFGETPFGAPNASETPFTGFEDPAKAIEQPRPQPEAITTAPVPVPEPGTHGLADDEDPFGMGADEVLADKGKEVETHKIEPTVEVDKTPSAELVKPKTEEDPEIAAAASQFPALSLQNSPATAPSSQLPNVTVPPAHPTNDDLPPLTEPTAVDESTDEDSDDEPLDKKAKRLTAQNLKIGGATAAPAPEPVPAPASVPVPALAAPTVTGASEFDDAFGLSAKPSATGASAFDEAFKGSNTGEPAKTSGFSFENSFDDNFDFAGSLAKDGAEQIQPNAINTTVNAFTPMTQSTVSPTVPTAFSFDDAFGTSSVTSNGKTESNPPSKGVSFDDAFGLSGSAPAKPTTEPKQSFDAFGAAFGAGPKPTTSTSVPAPEPVPIPAPVPALAASASTMSRPSPPTSPTSASMNSGRGSSPKNKRPESPKAQPRTRLEAPPEPAQRHSKLSLHFPSFGRSKTTKDKNKGKKDKGPKEPIPDMPPAASSSLLASPPMPGNGAATPAVDDDVEAVKTLCGMGFSRTQAVNALETHGYDVQKALNSLLS